MIDLDNLLALILVLTAVSLPGLPDSAAAGVSELRAGARGGEYREPPPAEVDRARELFRRLLAGSTDADLTEAWAELGFTLRTIKDGGLSFRVLAEASARREGRGFYVFPSEPRRSLLLQAPHTRGDLHTGEIALALLSRRPAAVAFSTVPRRQIDLAHHGPSYWNALTEAFADVHPRGHVLQLHGFSPAKRQTAIARGLDFIVSNGTDKPDRTLRRYVACLETVFQATGGVYPDDVGELGGTLNLQGQTLERLGHGGFVHLEMNRELRRRLHEAPDQAVLLEQCLR